MTLVRLASSGFPRLLLVGLLIAATGLDARSEVGIGGGTSPGGTALEGGPLILGITEDPSPIPPTVWRKYFPEGVGRIALNPSGESNGDSTPSILVDPATGLVLVAWARNSATGFDVVFSRFAGGAWTDPQVLAGGPADELDPALVLGPDGSIHVLYWVDDGATRTVMHRQAPSDLSAWSPAEPVSQSGESACRPSGVFHDGVLRVAYEVHTFGFGQTPRTVVLARSTASGFVPEVVAVTGNPGDVRPEVHSHAARLWVDWVDAQGAGDSGEIGWTRLDAQGHWESIRYQSFGNGEQRDYLVRGAVRMQAITP